MENTSNREEIDDSLYFGLPPLLPNPRFEEEPDLSIGLLSQTRPVSTIEAPPILPFSLNETLTFAPLPSSSQTGPILDLLSSPPALRTRYRDRSQTRQVEPTFLIPLDDLMNNNSNNNRSRVSNREQLEEFPQLRFQRLLDLNRTGTRTGPGTGTVPVHPDTNPERLMNNILALEASRRNKLKGGKNSTDSMTDRCQCGADFECNICLETCTEPVVTPCGHLFCWYCLFKWMKAQTIGITECPVCKGEITESNLTPIYGRGGNINGSGPVKVMEEKIPPRPSGKRTDSLRQQVRERTGGGSREELESVFSRLRHVTRMSRTAVGTVAIFAGFDQVGTGTGTESGTDGSSVGGEVHVRRRRRFR